MTEPFASTPPEIPDGMEPLPDFGAEAVGARYRTSSIRWRWAVAAVVAALSVVVVVTLVRVMGSSLIDLITMIAVVLILAVITAYQVLLALHGRAPVLVIDADRLRLRVPFNHVDVRLEAIVKVTPLRRDLLIEAPGGIERRGRGTRARWVAIDGAKGLEVDRKALASYLRRRAEQAAGPIEDTGAAPGGAD